MGGAAAMKVPMLSDSIHVGAGSGHTTSVAPPDSDRPSSAPPCVGMRCERVCSGTIEQLAASTGPQQHRGKTRRGHVQGGTLTAHDRRARACWKTVHGDASQVQRWHATCACRHSPVCACVW